MAEPPEKLILDPGPILFDWPCSGCSKQFGLSEGIVRRVLTEAGKAAVNFLFLCEECKDRKFDKPTVITSLVYRRSPADGK